MDSRKIAAIIESIAKSSLSVEEYFQKHRVPFSRAQYFRYKARLAEEGVEGLSDGRRAGNRRKLTPEAEGFLRGVREADPGKGTRELQQMVESGLGIHVDPTTISRFFHRVGEPISWPRPREPQRMVTACGGIEILGALALHLGWAEHTARAIVQWRESFRQSELYRQERSRRDRQGRDRRGQFTGAYNEREDVRRQRFGPVEEKRKAKNYSRMALFQVSEEVLGRKCLGVLSLPLITLNGSVRSANTPMGNALEHFCGYNYQHHTLDKFLREMKYAGVSEPLLRDQVRFWQAKWKDVEPQSGLPFLCYYIDGNTKPLWSAKRVKQNKVTMLGRVMGCLEQVFVHDGYGHPVYFETYSGKAPMGEYVLSLMEKIEDALVGPGPALRVQRVIVMDAASNGVGTLRAFAGQERYHYITALDDNQWNPRKVRQEGRAKRYYYGAATLRDSWIELEDSQEKGYLIVVRAIRIDWDHGKRTVLITSLPKEAVGASMVVKAYFDRWPYEELQFKAMKSFACLHRVAGYGKTKLPDEKVRQAQKTLQTKITALRRKLDEPLNAIAVHEERLAGAIEQERRIRSRVPVAEGKHILTPEQQADMTNIRRTIADCKRGIKTMESENHKDLHRLRQHEKEWLRLQGKEYVYRVDVELDQIMTYFRVALVNLASWFIHQYLGGASMSLVSFLHSILLLPAEIELTDHVRHIRLKRNTKDPKTMAALATALAELNSLQIQHMDGKRILFALI
jgi:transposase